MIARKSIQVVTAGDMSADINGDAINVQNLVMGSVQAVFTGAPVGNLKLQCSNIPSIYQTNQPLSDQIPTPAEVWTDIADTTVAVTEAGDVMWNITSFGYERLRVAYEADSGTGTLTAVFVGKG